MRLKTSLIIQQDAMIPQNETPVLQLNGDTPEDALALLPGTVRFLRCGCPSVQWLVTCPVSGERMVEALATVRDALYELRTPGERFGTDSLVGWKQGSVITTTRIVAAKVDE